MHPFRLHIASPCQQDWNAMAGSEKRRHCASCNHEVIALAEMTPGDAMTLVRNSKPHSLCLRIEHDDLGNVMFRQTAATSPSAPLLALTLGASLLVVGCNESAPSAAIPNLEKERTMQTVDTTKAKSPDGTTPMPEKNGPAASSPILDQTGPSNARTASSAAAQVGPGAEDRHVKPPNRSAVRVTTGCACAVGDKLCDCL